MKFIINDDKIEIDTSRAINSGSVNYYNIECEFNSTWDNLTKEIILKKEGAKKGIKRVVVDGVANIDTQINGMYSIGAKGYSISYTLTTDTEIDTTKTYYTRSGSEGSYVYTKVTNPVASELSTYYEAETTLQISTGLKRLPVNIGAGEIEVGDESIDTTEWQAYIHQIQTVVTQANNLNVTGARVSDGVEITFTSKTGTQTVQKINDGEGLIAGGTTGQVLKKKSNTDFDTEWADDTNTGVQDVKVDGTSVVTENVANIDLTGKVDKVTGKGLSTNDYTTEEKNKLAGIDMSTKEDVFRYSTMPTADSTNVGKIVEYVGTTGTYTQGYFYKNVQTQVVESIIAEETDNLGLLSDINVNVTTFKSKVNGGGTYKFVKKGYPTKLTYMNLNTMTSYSVTRDTIFDNATLGIYSWVDNSNQYYITNTLRPNAGTKLYSYDINTEETTDTGASYLSSSEPSTTSGYWTIQRSANVYEDADLNEYGITMATTGFPGNEITVTYVEAQNSYNWTQIDVQPHQDISGKVSISDIINDVTHTDTNKPLSANMGKELNDRIDSLSARGRFLSNWNTATGLPTTNPTTLPYSYQAGDYFIVSNVATNGITHTITITGTTSNEGIYSGKYSVTFSFKNQITTQYTTIGNIADYLEGSIISATGTLHTSDEDMTISNVLKWTDSGGNSVIALADDQQSKLALTDTTATTLTDTMTGSLGTTNYKPNGSSYTGVASTTVETDTVLVGDTYRYDGTNWILEVNTERTTTYSNIAGDPYDNSELASALNNKVNKVEGKGLSTEDYTSAEKEKLSGIEEGATKVEKTSDITNDSDFVSDSNYVHTDNNYSTNEKTKLSGIESGANKTTVDSSFSTTSENPVQNKVVKQAVDSINEDITNLTAEVRSLGHVYGIKRARNNNSSSAWERTDDSVGLVANATKNGSAVANDFDKLSPWKDIISINLDLSTKKVNAFYGESNFSFDGSNGDVYTRYPDIYYKIWQDENYDYIQIADYARTGFIKCSSFDIARYKNGIVDNKLRSYTGLIPAYSRTLPAFRTLAQSLGSEFCLLDWRYFVLQILYLVEYADYNTQNILGNGHSSMRFSTEDKALIAESSTNRIVINTTGGNNFIIGQTISIGASRESFSVASGRKITAIADYSDGTVTGKAITFDGSAVNIAVNNVIWSSPQASGGCDSLGMKSGCLANDGKHAMIYRGVEDWFSNINEWVDGLNVKDYQAWVCYEPANYVSDKFESPYTKLGYVDVNTGGYAKTLGFDSDNPLVRFPTEVGGGSNTYMSDYHYTNSGNRVALVGGSLIYGTSAGAWCWSLNIGSSPASWSFGCRVLKYQ